jgi:hypothetical protein
VIAHWEIEPLHRSRRGVEERLVLAAPWLLRAAALAVVRARSGSLFRRALLGRLLRVAMALVNRGDYQVVLAGVSPEVEVNLLPDAPEARPGDAQPVYRGREDYVKLVEIWKADFENLRWELRELIDPGGDRIAARAERIGRGVRSGVEVRATDFFVWQFERGVLRRQWILDSEAAMVAMLKGTKRLGG